MLDAITRVEAAVDRCKDFQTFEKDRDNQMVVERGLEIISEASKHLPTDLKQRHPEIPWKDVRSIGNILRHEYERTSKVILWETAQMHIPDLKKVCQIELEKELNREKTPSDLANELLSAGRQRKDPEPTPTPEIKTRSIWPDYSQGMELKKDDDKKGG